MSKYTTEVRFICESKSGLEVSGGYGDVDSIIANSWDKIFTTKVDFFDEDYRSFICCKILKHYYLREICCETVGIWKLWMNERLEYVMPYYNQLYESAKLEFNPLHDVDITRTHNKTNNETTNGKHDSENKVTGSSNSTTRDLYSDTPQGAITGLENEKYLTNARKVTDGGNYNNTTNSKESMNSTVNGLENYDEKVTGKQGTESYSSLLNKYRETFLNIDMQLINEFDDLFFGLW